MSSKFKMKLKGGRPATGGKLKDAIERSRAIQAGAQAAVNAMKVNTPVVTGNLKGSWGTSPGQSSWDGMVFKESVVNTAPYARKVDLTSHRNRGYIKRGLTQAGKDAAEAMRAQRASIVAELWVQKG